MGRALALCLAPLLLACLSLALAFMAATTAAPVAATVLLAAAGVLFAAACFKAVGAVMYRSFSRSIRERGEEPPVSEAEIAASRRVAATIAVAGAVCLAAAFVVGGPQLGRLLSAVLSL